MPQVAALYKKYKDQDFHVIGLECQGSDKGSITSLCQSKGVDYQITTGGDLRGSNVRGIPHGFLFGPDGKLASDDPSMRDLETKVKELLKDVVGAMAGPGPYKKLASLAAQIKSGRGLGTVLKTLRTKKAGKDAEEAKEAVMMFEALSGAATSKLERALSLKASDPVGALDGLNKLAQMFAGDEIGTKAKAEAAVLQKDPNVKKEIRAAGVYKQIEAMEGNLKPYRGEKNPKAEGFRKLNLNAIRAIVGYCQQLVKQYPGSATAKKAEALMNKYR